MPDGHDLEAGDVASVSYILAADAFSDLKINLTLFWHYTQSHITYIFFKTLTLEFLGMFRSRNNAQHAVYPLVSLQFFRPGPLSIYVF